MQEERGEQQGTILLHELAKASAMRGGIEEWLQKWVQHVCQ